MHVLRRHLAEVVALAEQQAPVAFADVVAQRQPQTFRIPQDLLHLLRQLGLRPVHFFLAWRLFHDACNRIQQDLARIGHRVRFAQNGGKQQ